MKDKNGFTLIELLAVIVILAVIALISTPLITDTIEKSRKNAAIQSAISYMDTVEFELSQALLNDSNMPNKNGEYEAKEDGIYQKNDIFKFDYKGTKVLGKMTLKENHVSKGNFNVGNYRITCYVRECTALNKNELTLADKLIKEKVQTNIDNPSNGLYAIGNSGELVTSSSPREYRYIGSNPDNYVKFNNELWRIIGIFDGQVKLIRKDSLGNMSWDKKGVDGGHGDYGENDWSKATLQTYLNGEYLNNIVSSDQSKIDNYTWKLGGISGYNDVMAQMFYERERGTTVYSGSPTEWTGKIALMYPSDYGFTTSGGSTTNRTSCLVKELYNWNDNSFSDCSNNSWIYNASITQWTLAPYAGHGYGVFYMDGSGCVRSYIAYDSGGVRPSLYLKSNVEWSSGTGTTNDPYILK